MLNIDTAKSYATEANLMTALRRISLDEYKFMVVRNRAGRFTAIFSIGLNQVGGNVTFAARLGFHTF